jgi:RNA polymerase sigma-70 factor (family 1)
MSDHDFHITGEAFRQRMNENGPAVFENLFRTFYPSLCVFAAKLLEDKEAVKDIVADLFAKIWSDPNAVTQVRDLSAYLYVATRNRCLNALEHKRVVKQHEVGAARATPDAEPEETVYRHLYEAETVSWLMQSVNSLPAECKNVVLLSLQGQSTSEIAQALNISPSAVSNQKARAIRLLKEQLPPLVWLSLCFVLQ